MGNLSRASFTALIERERDFGARGELGESSGTWKECFVGRASAWRDYVCESFCDTAAWLYSGVRIHGAFNLSHSWRKRREGWFRKEFSGKPARY